MSCLKEWRSGGGQTGSVISLQARFYCPLNDSHGQRGRSHSSSPPVSLCFLSSKSRFLSLLSSLSLSSTLFARFITIFVVVVFLNLYVSTQPLLSPVAADTIQSPGCALCDGADCRGPYRNHVPTWNRLTVSPQHSMGCQHSASQITTYCTAACNVCPPQHPRVRKEAYRIKKATDG